MFQEPLPSKVTSSNAPAIQADAGGNLYYIATPAAGAVGNNLVKIDVSNPNNLLKTSYSPDTDAPVGSGYLDGNAAYNYGTGSQSARPMEVCTTCPQIFGYLYGLDLMERSSSRILAIV